MSISGTNGFFDKFSAQLSEFHEVRPLPLPDIWVRDFLPLQNVQTGELYQAFFDPRYANYTPKLTAAIRAAVRGCFPKAKICNVRIDGGNILLTPDKKYAFCLEKRTIFHKSDPVQKEQVDTELKRALGVEEILWIPSQKGDKIGHIDGYVQFLGNFAMEATVEMYGGVTTGSLWNSEVADAFYRHYETKVGPYADIICLLCKPEADWLSARGLYVNFLETSRAVFVPQFNLSEGDKVISIMSGYTKKPLVRVDCSQIAQYGGAVHCLTREYVE